MIWHAIVVAAYGLSLAALVPRLMAFRDLPTAFVLLAIWTRYLLSGLHDYTYPSLVAGFSPIALHSLFVVAGGLILVPPRLYLRPFLGVFWVVLFMVAFTGLLNGDVMRTMDEFVRWLFFIVVALLLFRGMTAFGVQPVLRALLIITITPLALQFVGVAMGIRTMDQIGGWAYLAGYFHGGLFSSMLMTCLFVAVLIQWRWGWVPLVFAVLCAVGVTLANYRTSILASAPVILVHVGTMITQGALAGLRPIIVLVLAGGLVGGAVALSDQVPDRFSDALNISETWETLNKPPHRYTLEERDLLTGRAYLWSSYIYAWINGDTVNHLIGFGPGAYEDVFPKHSHNTLVSFLYEYGLLGVMVFFAIFLSQTWATLQVKDAFLALRLLACLGGYFILNMATGGMNGIEALILFAVLASTTWAYAEGQLEETATTPNPSPDRKLLGARWQSRRPGRNAETVPSTSTGNGAPMLGSANAPLRARRRATSSSP